MVFDIAGTLLAAESTAHHGCCHMRAVMLGLIAIKLSDFLIAQNWTCPGPAGTPHLATQPSDKSTRSPTYT